MSDATERFRSLLQAGRVTGQDFPTLAKRAELRGMAQATFDALNYHAIQREERGLAEACPAEPLPGESLTPLADRAAALSNPFERGLFNHDHRADLQEEATRAAAARASMFAALNKRAEEAHAAYHATADQAERRRALDALAAVEHERAQIA